MEINLKIEDSDLLWQTLDGVVLSVLKTLKQDTESELMLPDMHPQDKEMSEKVLEACKVLIKYYSVNEASEY